MQAHLHSVVSKIKPAGQSAGDAQVVVVRFLAEAKAAMVTVENKNGSYCNKFCNKIECQRLTNKR